MRLVAGPVRRDRPAQQRSGIGMATMRLWKMNAVGRHNLRRDTASVPSPARGEILVKVEAVSLNYRDKLVIETGMGLPLTFPLFPPPTWLERSSSLVRV